MTGNKITTLGKVAANRRAPRRVAVVWSWQQNLLAVQVVTGSCVTTWLATGSGFVTLGVGALTTVLVGQALYLHR